MINKKIIIVGGGRWARTIIKTLLSNFNENLIIYIHSPNNFHSIEQWSMNICKESKIKILKNIDDIKLIKPSAGIIVNKAKDHFKFAKKLLEMKIPTLIEKPITTKYNDTYELYKLAKRTSTYIAPALVFSFSGYLNDIAKSINSVEKINSFIINWSDPDNEIIDGEKKRYDPETTVVEDCLPHFLSLLRTFTNLTIVDYDSLIFQRGGSKISLNFKSDLKKLRFNISRKAATRERVIIINTKTAEYQINFSNELPVMKKNNELYEIDYETKSYNRPMARMIKAFFEAIDQNKYIKELDIHYGLEISKLTEKIMVDYLKLQKKWLKKSTNINLKSENVRIYKEYALKEDSFRK